MSKRSIVVFRQDLRIADNPALSAATNGEILPVFIDDQASLGMWPIGQNSRNWQAAALSSLNNSLDGNLFYAEGDTLSILTHLIDTHNITHVYWNRCYEPSRIAYDKTLKQALTASGIEVQSFNGSLLWEPWTILNQQSEPYKVYTPYYRKGCLLSDKPRDIVHTQPPLKYIQVPSEAIQADSIAGWVISEKGALEQFHLFLEQGLEGYKALRDFPSKPNTSRLSPYLHWGMISPHTLWHHVKGLTGMIPDNDIDHFLSELGWREFSYYQLYHHPTLPHENWQKKFDYFKWENSPEHLIAWQQGKTGIPVVDAAMRELLQTGYMHNRMRMVTASFLIKNLLIDWREGEKWFWEYLYDADLAANSASWQWVAGSGFDAAPYFRIFNPILQGKRFDPEGDYVRQYVPELANLPIKYLFTPWETPQDVLEQSGVSLDTNYPRPIVDLSQSRKEALARFKALGDSK